MVQPLIPTSDTWLSSCCNMGEFYKKDQEKKICAPWVISRLYDFYLIKFCINAHCFPVIEIIIRGTHDIIRARIYAKKKETVTALGYIVIQGFIDGSVLLVIKDILGYRRALSDTHLSEQILMHHFIS